MPKRLPSGRPLPVSRLLLAAVLLASCGGDGTTTPSPPPAPVATVAVSPASGTLAPGDTLRLTATVKDATGASLSGRSVTWSSGSASVASVSATGLVTAVAGGTATITATVEGISGSAQLQVSSAIAGPPGDPVVGRIARLPFVQVDSEYVAGHPELGAHPVSVRTVMVVVKPSATVAEANDMLKQVGATVVGALPGTAGDAPATLALRLPTRTHAQLEAALALLRAHPAVLVAGRDVLLGSTAVSTSRGSTSSWYWDPSSATVPGMGTWGLQAIRMPQAWNLAAQLRARGDTLIRTGVLDSPVEATHPDLTSRVVLRLLPQVTCTVTQTNDCAHGTHVAGTIGAAFNNGTGIDGVNPFARLVTRPYHNSSSDPSVATALWGLDDLIRDGAPLHVVNLSLGYNWYARITPPLLPPSPLIPGGPAQTQAITDGLIVAQALGALSRQGFLLPFIAAAAGNEGINFPGAQARFCSPFASAALNHGVAIIAVVENDDASGAATAPTYATNASSCLGGHLSAPGTEIVSTVLTGAYGRKTGTSMATPHVSGVAGFLYTLLPGLRAADMRKAVIAGAAHPPGPPFNGRPMLDAFAAALELDVITGRERVLTWLLDIDDGTADGNQRVDPFTGAETRGEQVARDSTVDMADFRRWRDWLLQLEDWPALALDGAAGHPKRDVNADSTVGTALEEALFPRGDFNGDGALDAARRRVVPGVLAARGPLTDLQVLQARFSDPHYTAAALDSLVDSGDLHLDLGRCQSLPGVLGLELEVRDSTSNRLRQRRTVAVDAGRQVFTVPLAPDRRTRVQVRLTQGGGAITTRDTTVQLALGADVAWAPECTALEITLPDTVSGGADFIVRGTPVPTVRWVAPTARSRRLQSGNVPVSGSDGSTGAYEIYSATAVTNRSGGVLRLAGEVDYLEAEVRTDDNESASISGRLTGFTIRIVVSGRPVRWLGSLQCGTAVSSSPQQGSASAAATASISFGGTALTCAAGSNQTRDDLEGTLAPGIHYLRVEGAVAVAAANSGSADAEVEVYWTINFQPQ